MGQIWDFLIPENPAAFTIVMIILFSFAVWSVGLVLIIRKLRRTKEQLLKLEDVSSLVKARQSHFIKSQEERDKTNEHQIFDEFIRNKLDQPIQPIETHLKSIFLAGWKTGEGHLQAAELIRHTSQVIFKWNPVIRSTLATFIVMGLLGTLFGLADSLAKLAPIMQNKLSVGTDANEYIVKGLGQLLLGLKTAFAPSIWGVALTIFGILAQSLYIRLYAGPVQETLEGLTLKVWIPELYPTRSQALQETIDKSFDAALKVAKVADKIESGSTEFSDNLVIANSMTRLFSEAATKLDHASETIEKTYATRLTDFSKEFKDNVDKLNTYAQSLKSLYEQMKSESESFHNTYSKTLGEQNTSLTTMLTGLKSYEEAYIKERGTIDAKMITFLDEATEASTSVSAKNRELVEGLNQQLVSGLNKVEEALRVQLTAIQDSFYKLHEPLAKTSDEIRGTFENFDKDIREVILKDMISHFRTQNDQNQTQLNAVQELTTKIVGVLTQFSQNSATQGDQLKYLSNQIVNFTDALKSFGGALMSLSVDLKSVIRKVDDFKRYKPAKLSADATVSKPRRSKSDDHPPDISEAREIEPRYYKSENPIIRTLKKILGRG